MIQNFAFVYKYKNVYTFDEKHSLSKNRAKYLKKLINLTSTISNLYLLRFNPYFHSLCRCFWFYRDHITKA